MTNIMEARFITGDNLLFEEMLNLTSTRKIWEENTCDKFLLHHRSGLLLPH